MTCSHPRELSFPQCDKKDLSSLQLWYGIIHKQIFRVWSSYSLVVSRSFVYFYSALIFGFSKYSTVQHTTTARVDCSTFVGEVKKLHSHMHACTLTLISPMRDEGPFLQLVGPRRRICVEDNINWDAPIIPCNITRFNHEQRTLAPTQPKSKRIHLKSIAPPTIPIVSFFF